MSRKVIIELSDSDIEKIQRNPYVKGISVEKYVKQIIKNHLLFIPQIKDGIRIKIGRG